MRMILQLQMGVKPLKPKEKPLINYYQTYSLTPVNMLWKPPMSVDVQRVAVPMKR